MNWLAFGVLAVAAIIWLIPLAWAVDTALKTETDTTAVPVTWIPPSGFTAESFAEVLAAGNLLRWYFNSFLTSSIITIVVVVLASLAAFGLSRVPFRGRRAVFAVILAGLMVPFQILIVPLFTEMDALGFVDTYQGIILPQIASPLAVFIFKQFFDGIPHELEDAARVDGASRFRVYWQVWMPLSRPAIAAVAIFTFVLSWNDPMAVHRRRGHGRGRAGPSTSRRCKLLWRPLHGARRLGRCSSAPLLDGSCCPAPGRAHRQHGPQGTRAALTHVSPRATSPLEAGASFQTAGKVLNGKGLRLGRRRGSVSCAPPAS